MILFEYKYIPATNIFNNIKLITQYSAIEYLLLFISVFILISTIYYIVPIINIFLKFRENEKTKEIRKQLIKQIAMQKDINDVIEKELDI